MKSIIRIGALVALLTTLIACGDSDHDHHGSEADHGHDHVEEPRGPNGGRLLRNDTFSLELAIVEAGIPPEFRVWITDAGRPVASNEVQVDVTLTRLGGVIERIEFQSQGDYLRGDTVVREPHSFVVDVAATYGGVTRRWSYDSFEGRTSIAADTAESAGIGLDVVGPATIEERVTVYGRVVFDPARVSHVSARYDGVLASVDAAVGASVSKGEALATVQANDSLNSYAIEASMDGVIVQRHANPGETTAGRTLFTIVDAALVRAELAVFPADLPRVSRGAPVRVRTAVGNVETEGSVAFVSPQAGSNQAVTVIVPLRNDDGRLAEGMYVTGEILVAEHAVPRAVRRAALQTFRDFTVVYTRHADDYEVRMLDLGRQDDVWAEVLDGIESGAPYVTENSYVIKADIEKSAAAHDH